jgi:hypothetical protein
VAGLARLFLRETKGRDAMFLPLKSTTGHFGNACLIRIGNPRWYFYGIFDLDIQISFRHIQFISNIFLGLPVKV